MKRSIFYAIVATTALTSASAANAAFTGDVTGGGVFSDDVATDNGWIIEVAPGNGVDFWTLTASANQTLSVDIDSDIDFGISIYKGEVSDDLGYAFDNDGDFSDPLSFNTGTYIGGTNGFFSDGGSSLMDVVLADAGVYTIAVGGDNGFGGFGGPFNYDMTVTQVPLPAALPLFAASLAGLAGLRRRQRKA